MSGKREGRSALGIKKGGILRKVGKEIWRGEGAATTTAILAQYTQLYMVECAIVVSKGSILWIEF